MSGAKPVRQSALAVLCGLGVIVVALGAVVPRLFVETPPATEGPSVATILTRFVVGTVVVLGLCAVTTWYCARRLRPPPAATGGELSVLEAVVVGGRCCVHLVRAGDQLLLAGVDATGLKALVHLTSDAPEDAGERATVFAARVTLADRLRSPG